MGDRSQGLLPKRRPGAVRQVRGTLARDECVSSACLCAMIEVKFSLGLLWVRRARQVYMVFLFGLRGAIVWCEAAARSAAGRALKHLRALRMIKFLFSFTLQSSTLFVEFILEGS